MAKRAPKTVEPDTGSAAPGVPPRVTLLDDLLGQEPAKRILAAAMRSGRVHHAWIFHGPAGVGKFTAAVAFGAALLDPTTAPDLGGNLAPDPSSQTQQLVRAGAHPDLHVITKELAAVSREQQVRNSKQITLAKDVVDEFLIEPAARSRVVNTGTPVGKAFVVDEAELMNLATQNSLLKTLEEPPAGTVLILVTASEDRLLTTIRSRCQRVPFTPLDDKQMLAWIKRAGVAAAGAQRDWLLSFAAGSPGVATVAIENDLFSWHEAVDPLLKQIDAGRFPAELGTTIAKLVDDRAAAWVKANPDASKDAANKAWARRMLAFLAEHSRAALRRAAPKAGDGDPAVRRALHALDAISAAESHLASNVNLTLAFENLAAQMAAEPQPV